MKTFFLATAYAATLAFGVQAQTPPSPSAPPQAPPMAATPAVAAVPAATPAPAATLPPAAVVAPAATIAPAPSVTATVADAVTERLKRQFDKKHKDRKGFNFTIGDDDDPAHVTHGHSDEIPDAVVPIVMMSVLAVFGFPVAIVAIIMFANWAKARSLHRTVQGFVEKGMPIPPELLASRAGAPLRPWYDLRRGIILLAVGVGIIFFFGAVAGFDAGVWALGLIPAIIGGGYILTWRLANNRENLLKQ